MKLNLLFLYFLLPVLTAAQGSYNLNDKVQDFTFTKTINNPSTTGKLGAIQSYIIILDFFGTWCVPCIKALPHLSELQQQFNKRVSILLISNEQQARLEKFISIRKPFPFVIIADEDNTITNLFAPPAYPYTVVLNKHREIIAITDAASLNTENITKWLQGTADDIKTPTAIKPVVMATTINIASSNKLVQLSQEFMYAAKTGEPVTTFIDALGGINYTNLKSQLTTDDEKKAFWINLYNGFTQVLLKQDPGKYKSRRKFFGTRQISIAGKSFSLDDIEHGILRRSKIKWSLGHLNKLFPPKIEKELRVKELDYRLHFALNCGAKSCPPIAFYNPENLNLQLTAATNAYLLNEAEYDAAADKVKLPAIMSWFRRDFGGKRKIIALLREKKIIPSAAKPRISFKPYDWTLYTNNYKN